MERHPVYGLSAAERGWVPALRYALRRQRVLRLVTELPHGRVLEVGCGAGALLADLAGLGFACEALETSETACELAVYLNQDRPDVRIHREPREDWAERFDMLLALEVLEHIEDDASALRLWRSWIRPDGRLLLSVPARKALWSASDVWVGHFRRYGRDGLLRLLANAGFVVEHDECYGYPLSNFTEWARRRLHGRSLRVASRAGRTVDLAVNTARSGTQRNIETRLYPLQASWPGVKLFQACCWLQDRFLERELGTGYLVMARRPR
ncbi:MAG TPA: class I SAM-dependent methyltransferase [Thermoanaerobaculia bacterium]|nr:class I SAM-dependent methyltransferase [Thermoanaerobaculia bacterium]